MSRSTLMTPLRSVLVAVVGLALAISTSARAQPTLSKDRMDEKRELVTELCGDQLSPAVTDALVTTRIVDAHTHLFNVRYLPLEGILYRYKLPVPVAGVLADVLERATPGGEFGSDRRESTGSPSRDLLSRISEQDRRVLEGYEPQIRKALKRTRRDRPGQPPMAYSPSLYRDESTPVTGQKSLGLLLELLGEATHPEEAEALPKLTREESFGDTLKGYLDMVSVLTEREDAIAQQLFDDHPLVDLYIHHMMDLEKIYASQPRYDLSTQLDRVLKLNARSPEALRFSVAYDPFHPEAALGHIHNAIERGAVAVKFYPPSGYRPAGTQIPPQSHYFQARPPFLRLPVSATRQLRRQWKSRYAGRNTAAIDALIAPLFDATSAAGIPIFSHHTPEGFQAGKAYGRTMAAPCYWQEILDEYEKRGVELEVILAHSGGGDHWFSEGDWSGSFDQQAYNLCVQYPNVYCDFGMSIEVLSQNGRKAFIDRLRTLVQRPVSPSAPRMTDACATKTDAPPRYDIRNKLLYGSDWHMMARVPTQKDLVCSFAEVFSAPGLESGAARFFGLNAVQAFHLGAKTR